ncbi:MAG: PAS domain S-box protein, partial [Gammaproteobacteria bacterium]|nr:PAS domain S-box protein [Gammaproteobacteria bacterium]
MTKPHRDLSRPFALFTTLGWALAPITGYSIAVIYGGIELSELLTTASLAILIPYLTILVWVGVHFSRFLNPVHDWIEQHPKGGLLPDSLAQHIQSFCGNYWSFHLLAVCLLPTIQHWMGIGVLESTPFFSLVNFMLLQLVIAILVGMPSYLLALSVLGRLGKYTGTTQLQISMRTKMLLVGGYIPLLTTTAMVKYYWWKTNHLSGEIMLAWALLGFGAFVITILAIRSLNQSLKPVEDAIGSSNGSSSYLDMAKRFFPQSTDEIGYMVQMLGRLFRRLGDQESYVNAIIENAAEAIIVINDKSEVVTFNPAAEKLFKYKVNEIHGQPVCWLLPEIKIENVKDYCGNRECMGQDGLGDIFDVSLHISEMQTDGETFYTCLVSDISERKASEFKLREAEARYRDLVETAHDLVWSMDLHGRWTYLNSAATRIYGHSIDDMLGRNFTQFQARESYERDMHAFARVLDGQELLQYETVHVDKEGSHKHISFNAKPLYDDDGNVIRITGTAHDITEQKIFERELTYQAQHDSLTGLYNRNYFQQELQRLISRVARSGAECALLYLDLDQFKYVNDTLGHAAGDRLLLECTNLLKANIREGDLLARFGGDEFTILLYGVNHDTTERVAENIRHLFESYRYMDSGKSFNVTCS